MSQTKPVGSPVDATSLISKNDQDPESREGNTAYRSITESQMYLATYSGPDLGVLASMLRTHVVTHCRLHSLEVNRALRYLRGTSEGMPTLNPCHSKELTAFSDVCWGNK